MITRKRTVLLFLCAMTAAVAANAQVTTKVAEVVLRKCPNVPDDIRVVLNGEQISARRIEGTNRWRTEPGGSFDASRSFGSLRIGGASTDCMSSRAFRKPGTDEWIAEFTFTCVQQSTWPKLSIEATPSNLEVSYARVISGSRCNENARLIGRGFLPDVAPNGEEVYLHLGALPEKYHLYLVLVAPGRFGEQLTTSPTVTLNSTKVIDEYVVRNGRNVANLRDITRTDLDRIGFKKIVLKREE